MSGFGRTRETRYDWTGHNVSTRSKGSATIPKRYFASRLFGLSLRTMRMSALLLDTRAKPTNY